MSDLLPRWASPSFDPTSLPTSVLEAELIASVGAHNTSVHAQLRMLLAYDHRQAWVSSGATSCAAWWAATAEIELSTARDQMRVARALNQFTTLDQALASQDLSYAKVRYLARYVDEDTVADLVKLASGVPAGRLPYVLAAYRSALLTNDELTAIQHANRSVSWKVDADGMVVITARLPPSDGASLTAQINAEVSRGSTQAGDLIGQQRADGLLNVLARRLSNNITTQSAAEVIVHVMRNTEGALVHTLEDGTPLPHAQASELLCGATIRALVHASTGQPIDASPAAPGPTKRQLRLLKARDKHCQFGICRATSFLHAHHIEHREHGGPTTIANLTLVCSFHHRHIHTNDVGWAPSWKAAAA